MKLGAWLVMLTVMIMFITTMGINTGLNPILTKLGVTINSDTSQLQTADLESSTFWDKLFNSNTGFLIVLAGGAVIVTIGLFARGYDTSLILLPFVIFVSGLYIKTFWSLISFTLDFNQWWLTSIVGIIFTGLGVGFIMANVDYFGGR
ncbi:MAG TPA: hypothetical protein ENG87_01750 [Candidatus Pacearchaeota archaeon]|nr:hypothetical protein [Candidatus Pacearchaeota archaeon]